jgi:RHH-type proline utilization regulon transcriptional repressor/proline dehydrogenase/delta 1-pyrroline-5-carboxylate dehydrogenase
MVATDPMSESTHPAPFAALQRSVRANGALRAAIIAATRRPEPDCLPPLLKAASFPPDVTAAAGALARDLVLTLRAKGSGSGVESLIQEFSLSSQEGIALLCLAEALLRIPDSATRDALIRDKLARGNWRSHLGNSPSLFVNAATWGLLVTGHLVCPASETGLSAALTRLIAKGGEPVIRKGVDMAMRMLGEQFVAGQTIKEALANGRKWEAKGFRYSYDMLGEAALTAADVERYFTDYQSAIHAIGQAAGRKGVIDGPGISIKLSALHPRYSRAQRQRVMAELAPRLLSLAQLAHRYDIGLNIDAEESERLDLSLDLLEMLCFDPVLAGWNGIGFVLQAYQKRAPFVLDHLIDLAARSHHRLMVRLVKGAYWDAEIKRAQLEGLSGFPVYTRKIYTDISYLACAAKMLDAEAWIFPQFATHNAQTLATLYHLAGQNFAPGRYEFQCLHGMGEPLYEEVVGPAKLDRPARIYAPVGTHETLLPYLVRRLLENGANTSFVNRIADAAVPVDALTADPVAAARDGLGIGLPHPKILLPDHLPGDHRVNSRGFDLADEAVLQRLSEGLIVASADPFHAAPILAAPARGGPARPLTNPADRGDRLGDCVDASPADIATALAAATAATAGWHSVRPTDRARLLQAASDLFEQQHPTLLALLVREAGKSLANAVGELREAVDFLRYYAAEIDSEGTGDAALGVVLCISPWNFPLAIFIGQIAAALAAGNVVLAKPAEETPLIAAMAVRLMHQAGIPPAVLQLLTGDGQIGAALVAAPEVQGVMFTGSTEIAKAIQQSLAERLRRDGQPVTLIAETGGQNAMVIDSSAHIEQVVADVLASAFDSAGQRCSALRLLCVQEEIADLLLLRLQGAMNELVIGPPDDLASDIGPVISATARDLIERHVANLRQAGHKTFRLALPLRLAAGSFVAPTLIEIDSLAVLRREIFGPVLHVLRFRRNDLGDLLAEIKATGYGLTFGLHSRIEETIAYVTARAPAGNIYVNRNMIGAVVGVQPFGGQGLSGTGPKAGGPLILRRLMAKSPSDSPRGFSWIRQVSGLDNPGKAWCDWINQAGWTDEAARCADYLAASKLNFATELPGPVGESNLYRLDPKGTVLCLPETRFGLALQVGAALATGNQLLLCAPVALRPLLAGFPAEIKEQIQLVETWEAALVDAVLLEGDRDRTFAVNRQLASRDGPIIALQSVSPQDLAGGQADYCLDWLLCERSISINTAAAGGNASLMTIG